MGTEKASPLTLPVTVRLLTSDRRSLIVVLIIVVFILVGAVPVVVVGVVLGIGLVWVVIGTGGLVRTRR